MPFEASKDDVDRAHINIVDRHASTCAQRHQMSPCRRAPNATRIFVLTQSYCFSSRNSDSADERINRDANDRMMIIASDTIAASCIRSALRRFFVVVEPALEGPLTAPIESQRAV
jgi:hypothetical protein